MSDALDRLDHALSGRYRLERELGAGGMATVYLAEDLKHDRRVALKVLKPELSAIIGAERFLNEIRVTANLQHPNILPLYDSGEADTFLYYVMPYVEGETLRHKLDREKQLSVEGTLEIAKAVAAALQYAHERGVVHRDIKPANILLQAGQALVADFGIALAVRQAGGARLTETGLSLGTPHYMSPEQASGDRELDARSDIYSLGAMVYEMLVGDPPHTGSTVQAIVAKVLTETPTPIRRSRDRVPGNVDAAVQRALAKTPADRFASAEDFARALSDPHFHRAEPEGVAVTGRSRLLERLAWLTAVILVGLFALTSRPDRPTPVGSKAVTFSVALPAERAFDPRAHGVNVALSPDGATLAYVGASRIERQLYIRALGDLEVRPLDDTEGAYNPVFSPDGEWIAFISGDAVRKVRARGGAAQTLARLRGAVLVDGLSWKNNDTLIVLQRPGVGLASVPATGGSLTTLVPWDTLSSLNVVWPEVLPDGDAAIVAKLSDRSSQTDVGQEIGYYDFGDGTFQSLGIDGVYATYSDSGYLLVVSVGGAVNAVPFDAQRRAVTGEPVPLLPAVSVGLSQEPKLAEAGGTLVYVVGAAESATLVLVDRAGGEVPLLGERPGYRNPRFAPDGRRLAVVVAAPAGGDIWVYDFGLETLSRLTFESDNFYPEWSPNGKEIAFTSRRISAADIFLKPSDGSGEARLLLDAEPLIFTGPWLPDGSGLFARETDPERGFDLWLIPRDTSQAPRILLATPFNEGAPAISPDGRWLAYVSDESGRNEVYVRDYPELGGRWQVSAEGGSEPRWRPDGDELFYRQGSGLYVATIDTRSGFRVLRRERLFEGSYARQVRWTEYDVHPDGQRFVMIRTDELSNELVLAVNWTALLGGAGRSAAGQ